LSAHGNWTEKELAYLAGIIDGEGSFCLHNFGTHRFGSGLAIGNTDLRLMEWIHSHFGGVVRAERRTSAKWKQIWRWTAKASEIEAITRAVLPYLIVKRQQAELLLAYRATVAPVVNTKSSTNDTSHEVKQERFRIHTELRALNKRGA
jgi:hypothetical protein